MSERGSFVTEYIYCNECLESVKSVLLAKQKYLCSEQLDYFEDSKLPIIAGKIGGGYGGEELHTFEFELMPEIEKLICHPVRVSVLAEVGSQIFTVNPTK